MTGPLLQDIQHEHIWSAPPAGFSRWQAAGAWHRATWAAGMRVLEPQGRHTLSARVGHTLSALVGHTLSARVGHTLSARVGHTLSARVGQPTARHTLSARVGHTLSARVGQPTARQTQSRLRRTAQGRAAVRHLGLVPYVLVL